MLFNGFLIGARRNAKNTVRIVHSFCFPFRGVRVAFTSAYLLHTPRKSCCAKADLRGIFQNRQQFKVLGAKGHLLGQQLAAARLKPGSIAAKRLFGGGQCIKAAVPGIF